MNPEAAPAVEKTVAFYPNQPSPAGLDLKKIGGAGFQPCAPPARRRGHE